MDRLPLGRGRREIYRDPVVIPGVRLVKSFIQRGCVGAGRLRHLVDRNVGATGRMKVLQVKSLFLSLTLALIGQFSIGR